MFLSYFIQRILDYMKVFWKLHGKVYNKQLFWGISKNEFPW